MIRKHHVSAMGGEIDEQSRTKYLSSHPVAWVLFCVLCSRSLAAAPDPIQYNTPTGRQAITAMLQNFHDHGYNQRVGGLYINWDAFGANYYGSGRPDIGAIRRHDPLTDLRYLANLWRYRRACSSHRWDADIRRFTPIVYHEYAGHVDARGWVYTVLAAIAHNSGDMRFQAVADRYPALYARGYLKPARVDYDFEEAAVLVQSANTRYVTLGRQRLNKLFRRYYNPSRHLVLFGNELKTSQEGDIIVALARAGRTAQARKLLAGLQVLWDPVYGGFAEGATLNPWRIKNKKTGGRQANILIAARLLHDNRLIDIMRNLILRKAYLPAYQGVVYEQTPNWRLYRIHGRKEDWVTSEAMGITIHALLLTLRQPRPH